MLHREGEGTPVSVLWVKTEAFFHPQAMSIYSTLAKPRAEAAAAATAEEEQSEEPANQTPSSH